MDNTSIDNKISENNKSFDLNAAKKLAQFWKITAIAWQILDHLFVIGSFMASVLVIFISADSLASRLSITVLSSISAVLTLMGFACNPRKYMRNYRKAFQELNAAILSCKQSSNNQELNQVINAIIQGETYIGETYDADFVTKNEDHKSDTTED